MKCRQPATDLASYPSLKAAVDALGESGVVRAVLAANERTLSQKDARKPVPSPTFAGAA